jgi:hypothetical protein
MNWSEISAVKTPVRRGYEPVIVIGEDERGRIGEEFAATRVARGNDHGSGAVIDEQAIVPERDANIVTARKERETQRIRKFFPMHIRLDMAARRRICRETRQRAKRAVNTIKQDWL